MKIIRYIVLLLAFVASIFGLAAADEYAWDNVDRIVAIGDVHGDYERFLQLLRLTGLVNDENAWTGGKTHLVQVGDVLDRGPKSKFVIDLLRKLSVEAREEGGYVHPLIGNHEILITKGDTRYVHPGEFQLFGGREKFLQEFGPSGNYGSWVRNNNTIIKINDLLFLHGGISPRYAKNSLKKINQAVRQSLDHSDYGVDGILMSVDGPLWYRGYAVGNIGEFSPNVDRVLSNHHARHIVVGHTVSHEGIKTRLNGRVIMIDVGYSRSYLGNDPACLLIEKGRFYEVRSTGIKELELSRGASKR
ncbi:MAG: metallophosphatase [Gammaproteobacteria bacterium]|nr:metallophosphatase [Gammaproteobacteria bacterium]